MTGDPVPPVIGLFDVLLQIHTLGRTRQTSQSGTLTTLDLF